MSTQASTFRSAIVHYNARATQEDQSAERMTTAGSHYLLRAMIDSSGQATDQMRICQGILAIPILITEAQL